MKATPPCSKLIKQRHCSFFLAVASAALVSLDGPPLICRDAFAAERVWVPIYARVKPPRPITARVNTRSAAAISPDDDAADRWKSTLTAASSQASFK